MAPVPAQQNWVWDGQQWTCGCDQPPPCPPSYPPPGCPPWFNPPAGQAPWYPGANGGVSFSQTAPANPVRGHFWWDGSVLWLFDGVAWVDASSSISYSSGNAVFNINKPSLTGENQINGLTGGVARWTIVLGDSAPEVGGNTGSDFVITRLNDAGFIIDYPMGINRSNGIVTFSHPIVNPSDIAIKSNIEVISNALDKVMKLTGISFDQDGSDRRHIGLVAQDVEPHVPEVVFDIGNKQKGISYSQLTALLIEAVKTLAHRVGVLEGTEV